VGFFAISFFSEEVLEMAGIVFSTTKNSSFLEIIGLQVSLYATRTIQASFLAGDVRAVVGWFGRAQRELWRAGHSSTNASAQAPT